MVVHSFQFIIRLIRAYCRLFFPTLLGVVLGPAMFAVTSRYSVSENVLFLWEQCLLDDRKVEVNHLNTGCLLTYELQRHLESITVMSRLQQQGGVI